MPLVNRSGSIAAGGVAQELMPANLLRLGFSVMNQSFGDLWINDLGSAASAAQPSMRLSAGALYETVAGQLCPHAVSIVGATTGQAFTAREW